MLDQREKAVRGTFLHLLQRLYKLRHERRYADKERFRGDATKEREFEEEQKNEVKSFKKEANEAKMKAIDKSIKYRDFMQWLKEESERIEGEIVCEVEMIERGKYEKKMRGEEIDESLLDSSRLTEANKLLDERARKALRARNAAQKHVEKREEVRRLENEARKAVAFTEIPSSARFSIDDATFILQQSVRRYSMGNEPLRVTSTRGGIGAESILNANKDGKSLDESLLSKADTSIGGDRRRMMNELKEKLAEIVHREEEDEDNISLGNGSEVEVEVEVDEGSADFERGLSGEDKEIESKKEEEKPVDLDQTFLVEVKEKNGDLGQSLTIASPHTPRIMSHSTVMSPSGATSPEGKRSRFSAVMPISPRSGRRSTSPKLQNVSLSHEVTFVQDDSSFDVKSRLSTTEQPTNSGEMNNFSILSSLLPIATSSLPSIIPPSRPLIGLNRSLTEEGDELDESVYESLMDLPIPVASLLSSLPIGHLIEKNENDEAFAEIPSSARSSINDATFTLDQSMRRYSMGNEPLRVTSTRQGNDAETSLNANRDASPHTPRTLSHTAMMNPSGAASPEGKRNRFSSVMPISPRSGRRSTSPKNISLSRVLTFDQEDSSFGDKSRLSTNELPMNNGEMNNLPILSSLPPIVTSSLPSIIPPSHPSIGLNRSLTEEGDELDESVYESLMDVPIPVASVLSSLLTGHLIEKNDKVSPPLTITARNNSSQYGQYQTLFKKESIHPLLVKEIDQIWKIIENKGFFTKEDTGKLVEMDSEKDDSEEVANVRNDRNLLIRQVSSEIASALYTRDERRTKNGRIIPKEIMPLRRLRTNMEKGRLEEALEKELLSRDEAPIYAVRMNNLGVEFGSLPVDERILYTELYANEENLFETDMERGEIMEELMKL